MGIPVADIEVTQLLGKSDAMCKLRGYLPKVARSDATVLITGETGTGKEKVAEIIHALSSRNNHRLVAVNCAALPENLIESELFGHTRGAFTGAYTSSKGKIGEADHGTLFLDEIGEMSLAGQAKLLRVLESRELIRVGSARPEPIDIRVIAATNQNLEELVDTKLFRIDLFYRLNVAWVELAPLRERPDDIPEFLTSFIKWFNQHTGHSVGMPDSELMSCLSQHKWPGNIRELRNMIEAVFIDPPSGTLRVEHLPLSFRKKISTYHHSVPQERQLLVDALQRTNWNKSKAAKNLNWSRMTVYRKMAKYHLTSSTH